MDWRTIARAQGGVVTRDQLRLTGVSDRSASRMSVRGELDRISAAVYLVGGAPLTFRAQLWAGVLATGGILGFGTAGRLWGVAEDADQDVHVIVPHSRRIIAPGRVIVHRCGLPSGTVRYRSELPITSRPWTVLDLLATMTHPRASRLADRAIQRGWIDEQDLARRLRDHPRRPGNSQLRRIAASLGDGAAAESERVLHRLLRKGGIIGWVPNYEVWSGGELVGVVDVALPTRGIAIEVDGMAYHVDVDRFRRDRSRQNALVALGWTVLRFTWADLVERPGYVIATIQRLAA